MSLLQVALEPSTLVVAVDPGKVANRVWMSDGSGLLADPVSLPVSRDGIARLEALVASHSDRCAVFAIEATGSLHRAWAHELERRHPRAVRLFAPRGGSGRTWTAVAASFLPRRRLDTSTFATGTAKRGYQPVHRARLSQGTTLRMLAEAADCDPALVAHHFGSKRGLFAQVAALLLSQADVVERALPGPPELLGQRVLGEVITAWEDQETGPRLARLVHATLEDPRLLAAFREYVDTEISQRLVEFFGVEHARDRTASILTLIVGIIFGRYVIKTDVLAKLPAERYRRALTPQANAAARGQCQATVVTAGNVGRSWWPWVHSFV